MFRVFSLVRNKSSFVCFNCDSGPFISRHPLMKRRSRSSPPLLKRHSAEPGTPGPFTAELARDRLQQDFCGASPSSTRKSSAFRKQLFQVPKPMVTTRLQESTMHSTPDDTSSEAGASGILQQPRAEDHFTPPEHFIPGPDAELIINAPRSPQCLSARAPRDPPDVADVLTQQTAVLDRPSRLDPNSTTRQTLLRIHTSCGSDWLFRRKPTSRCLPREWCREWPCFSSSRSLSWLDMISTKPGLYYRWFFMA